MGRIKEIPTARVLIVLVALLTGTANVAEAVKEISRVVPGLPPITSLIVSGVFAILIACLFAVSGDSYKEKTKERAWDIIKIAAGFFIGTLTNLLK
jgi:hypothetical protein